MSIRSRANCDVKLSCSVAHPPVVTLGRGTKPGDVFGWTGETYDVSRGGRATYHGPSQIVAYPILDLNSRGRDLHLYMRKLEVPFLGTLQFFRISALANTLQIEDGACRSFARDRRLDRRQKNRLYRDCRSKVDFISRPRH
jgi:lipoate-protein ligase B